MVVIVTLEGLMQFVLFTTRIREDDTKQSRPNRFSSGSIPVPTQTVSLGYGTTLHITNTKSSEFCRKTKYVVKPFIHKWHFFYIRYISIYSFLR